MGLFFACLSIVLAYFSPVELIPALAPYHVQLGIMLFGLAVSLPTLAGRPDRGLQSPQYLLVIGLWGAIVVSLVIKLKIRWGFEALVFFGSLVAIYFLTTINTFNLNRIKLVGGVLVACAVVMGFQAIVAYHTGYLGSQLLLLQPGNPAFAFGNRVRGFGFLQDPNDFAQFLLVALALLGLYWKRSRTVPNLMILGPPAVILIYASYLTFSRGGLLGLGAILFFSIYRKERRAPAFAAAGLGTLVLYAMHYTGGREMGVENGRIMAWGAGVSAAIHHPLFGIGFGRFIDINDLTAHNSFVLCFTELGMFGYFFWMALLVITFIGISALSRLEAKTAEDREISSAVYAIRAAFCAFLVTGWFLSRTYTETLYILLALAASLIHLRPKAIPAPKLRFGHWAPRTVALQVISFVAVYVAIKARLL
jgi:O-Antigen ligase